MAKQWEVHLRAQQRQREREAEQRHRQRAKEADRLTRAAEREAERQHQQAAKEAERAARAAEEAVAALLKAADKIDAEMARDAIAALGLHFEKARGIVAAPVDGFPELYAVVPERAPEPLAPMHDGPSCELARLDLRVASFGVVLAVAALPKVTFRLDIVASDPKKSRVFLVDRATGSYLYPRLTSLPSNLVAGAATVGLIVFEPVRAPAAALEVHALDLKLGDEKVSFEHVCAAPWLEHESRLALDAPTVRQLVEQRLQREAAEREAAEAARREALRQEELRRSAEAKRRHDAMFKVFGIGCGGLVLLAIIVGVVAALVAPDAPVSKPASKTAPVKSRR